MADKIRRSEDITYYKRCRKKIYDAHVCMPPRDTVVINKFEQSDVVKMLNGKEYFTVAELERMQQNGDGRFNIITQALNAGKAYLVNDKTPFVLAGTMGELRTISPDNLASKFNFVTNDGVIPINQQTLQQRMSGGCLDWTVVRSVPDNSEAWACFVPLLQKGTVQTSWGAVSAFNAPGVSHGKGDFIIAQDAGGKPNMTDRYVVNGEVFATTYNNQGWTNCLNPNLAMHKNTINLLPKLVPDNSVGAKANFISKLTNGNEYLKLVNKIPNYNPTLIENTVRKVDETFKYLNNLFGMHLITNVKYDLCRAVDTVRYELDTNLYHNFYQVEVDFDFAPIFSHLSPSDKDSRKFSHCTFYFPIYSDGSIDFCGWTAGSFAPDDGFEYRVSGSNFLQHLAFCILTLISSIGNNEEYRTNRSLWNRDTMYGLLVAYKDMCALRNKRSCPKFLRSQVVSKISTSPTTYLEYFLNNDSSYLEHPDEAAFIVLTKLYIEAHLPREIVGNIVNSI